MKLLEAGGYQTVGVCVCVLIPLGLSVTWFLMFQNAHYWHRNLNVGFQNKMQMLFCLTVSLNRNRFWHWVMLLTECDLISHCLFLMHLIWRAGKSFQDIVLFQELVQAPRTGTNISLSFIIRASNYSLALAGKHKAEVGFCDELGWRRWCECF